MQLFVFHPLQGNPVVCIGEGVSSAAIRWPRHTWLGEEGDDGYVSTLPGTALIQAVNILSEHFDW